MVSKFKIPNSSCFYLPYHAVLKESSNTIRLSVVFDGSCKFSSGISLNDKFLVGSKLQDNLFNILLRFRKYKIAYTAAIAKMYSQILMSEEDREYQRIFWRNSTNEMKKSKNTDYAQLHMVRLRLLFLLPNHYA